MYGVTMRRFRVTSDVVEKHKLLHILCVCILRYEKILSTPSFGGEAKPSVPCRRFAACKISLNLSGSRNLGKITGHFLAYISTFRY